MIFTNTLIILNLFFLCEYVFFPIFAPLFKNQVSFLKL